MLLIEKEDSLENLLDSLLKISKKDGSRKLVMRKLNDQSKISEECLKNAVVSTVRALTEQASSTPSIESTASYFESIKTLQEDLSLGRQIVRSAKDVILPGVSNLLLFHSETLSGASPSTAQKIYKCLQTTLHFLSHYLSLFEPPVGGLDTTLKLCLASLNLEGAPLDVISNSGIVVVLLLKLMGDIGNWKDIFDSTEPLQQMSLMNGLLSVFDARHLSEVVPEGGMCAIADSIIEVSSRNTDSTFALLAARTLESWTSIAVKELEHLKSDVEFRSQFSLLFKNLLEKLWSDLDHAVDSVRLSARRSFEGLIKFAVNVQGTDAVDMVLKMALQAPLESRRRYLGLACALAQDSEPAFAWTQVHALDLINQCLNPIYSSLVKECISSSLRWSSANWDEKTFSSRWLEPLLAAYEASGSQHLYLLIEQAVKGSKFDLQQLKNCGNLRILLTFLLVCKKSGIAIDESDENDALKKSLTAADHQVRLNGLKLIIASPKTIEPIRNNSLNLLQEFLHLNFYCQTNDTRHQFIGIVKKIISRLSASSKSIFRPKLDITTNPSFAAYISFLNWLWTYCISRVDSPLFPTRCIALQILKLLKDFFLCDLDSKIKIEVSSEHVETLLIGFEDSYEENKLLALEVLTSIQTDYFETDNSVQELYKVALENLVSIRPPTTIAGAILLRLLLRKGCYRDSSSKDLPPLDLAFDLLLGVLEGQVEVGKRSLLEAAAVGPFYGVIGAMRGILVDPVLRSSVKGPAWKKRLHDTLELAKEVCTLVMPVVASSSPEGHLPMDLETVCMSNVVSVLSRNGLCTDNHGLEPFPVSSQLLLVCCWRSVKEVSLLIGQVMTDLPVNNLEEGLLHTTEALELGQFLLDVLLDSKHRGAFEQAAVGFTMVCSAFFKSDTSLLSEQPRHWLEQVISDLESGTEASNYCATRRSAGLPFMILAIFHGEMAVSSNALFKGTIPRLLSIVEKGELLEAKVHAYNILRFLYRDAKLGEIVHPFISDGVRLAIVGCRSSMWAERNAATLMFSALMTRIFGVNRPSDPANRSAGVTGRTFFHQHPSLFSFLLEELQAVVKSVDRDLHPSLFPILLLLSRLQPSSGALQNQVLKMSFFVPCIIECAASPIMKVRELAARALPSLVEPPQMEELLRSLCRETYHNRGMNRLHGLLLQMMSLLSYMPYCTSDFFLHWLSKAEQLLNPTLPADISLVLVKILSLNFTKWKTTGLAMNCDWKKFLERLGSIVVVSGNSCTLPILQAEALDLYSKIAFSLVKFSSIPNIIHLAMGGSYETRISALENILKNCQALNYKEKEKLLATVNTPQLFTESHPTCLARWIDLIGCRDGKWDDRTFELLKQAYLSSQNEELSVSAIVAIGGQFETCKKNLCLVLDAVKPVKSATLRQAAVECLERNKSILEQRSSQDASSIAWAIILHALHDETESIWLPAARVASSLVEPTGDLTLHPYLCIEKIVKLLQKEEGHVLEFVKNSLQQEADNVDEEMDDENSVFPRSTCSGSGYYFLEVLSSQNS